MNTVQSSLNQIGNTVKTGTDLFLENISRSPLMIGFAVLMINLGGRYLAGDITQYDEKVLNNKVMKKLTIFAIVAGAILFFVYYFDFFSYFVT